MPVAEENITSVNSLIKYLVYLIDYADLICSQETLSENNYASLLSETNLFHRRVSNSTLISDTLKTEFLNIKLPQLRKEFSLSGIFRRFYLRLLTSDETVNDKIENQFREDIKEFRDRLDNIFNLIKLKSL